MRDDSDNEELDNQELDNEELDNQLQGIDEEKYYGKLEQSEIFSKLKMIIVEQLDVDYNDIDISSNFAYDLDADSLDAVELIMALEEAFGIQISDEDAEKIQTVEQALKYILDKLN
ncbi:MAG: acyl carrier protein [Cyanobacterium sp. T60_A2020_053]|nr:acyl carrier protein [Cyanobacterium sp. T60_A2020_053]